MGFAVILPIEPMTDVECRIIDETDPFPAEASRVPQEVTDAMVEAAILAYPEEHPTGSVGAMRIALEAAFQSKGMKE
jgi:hypothetical protein